MLPAGRGPLPAAAEPPGQGHQGVEVDPARPGQHDILRAVAAAEVFPHRRHRQLADALGGAQHAPAQRVRAVVQRPALVVGPERRLVLVHLNLFEDHLLLGVEIVLAERGAEDVGQQFRRPVLVLRQHGGVVDRVLLVGEGVVVGAHLVELAVHVVGRAGGGALEHHVFEEMAHAGHGVALVAGAGADEEPQRRGIRRGVPLGDNLQPVGQGVSENSIVARPIPSPAPDTRPCGCRS